MPACVATPCVMHFYAMVARRGGLLHSDHGSQHSSREYRAVFAGFGSIRQSMGRRHYFDNACMESFFATLKKKLVYRLHALA